MTISYRAARPIASTGIRQFGILLILKAWGSLEGQLGAGKRQRESEQRAQGAVGHKRRKMAGDHDARDRAAQQRDQQRPVDRAERTSGRRRRSASAARHGRCRTRRCVPSAVRIEHQQRRHAERAGADRGDRDQHAQHHARSAPSASGGLPGQIRESRPPPGDQRRGTAAQGGQEQGGRDDRNQPRRAPGLRAPWAAAPTL